MYIKCNRDGTRRLLIPEIDDPVTFNGEGVARVPKEVGKILVEKLDSIEVRDKETEGESDSNSKNSES